MSSFRTTSRREFIKSAGAAGILGAAGACRSAADPHDGPQTPILLAGYPYDRVAALTDGTVEIAGCESTFERSNIYALNGTAMGGDQRFDIQEIGLHPYMLAFANDAFRDYTLIPVFPLRTFRHKSMFVRVGSGIERPADLRGKTIATPGYSQSSLVWIRGVLQHEYGIAPADMRWVISASSDKGKATRNESVLPEGVTISPGPPGVNESELLARGEVDAAFVATEPKGYTDGSGTVERLFRDYRSVERAYFAKTGIFPIMHAVAIRKDVVERDPGLPVAAFKAYSAAKRLMYEQMSRIGWAMISLPWLSAEFEDTRALMGDDYWPYGIARNRVTLDALFEYSHEQGLAKRRLTVEELFHPSTLEIEEEPL